MEVRRSFGTIPVDPGREALEAIASHAVSLALARHSHVLGAAGEDDAPLGRRSGFWLRPRGAQREDALVETIHALASRGGDGHGLATLSLERFDDPRYGVAGFREIDLVEREQLGQRLERMAVRRDLRVDRRDGRQRIG